MKREIFFVAQVIAIEGLTAQRAQDINANEGWAYVIDDPDTNPYIFKLMTADLYEAVELSHRLYCPGCS